jgi:hypothetical protein
MLKVSRLTKFDKVPPEQPRPPLSCRLRLWHRWVRVHVDGEASYVMCERCQRLAGRTIFDNPVP